MAIRIVFRVTNTWDTGFSSEIVLVNDSSETVEGWNIAFTAPWTIIESWNAKTLSAPNYIDWFSNLDWNGTLSPGQSTSFGFNATGTATPPVFFEQAISLDDLPTLMMTQASVLEGQSGTSAMIFDLALSKASSAPVTVRWDTTGMSATAGTDFRTSGGMVTFVPGQTHATIQVDVLGDSLAEASETFRVVLTLPNGAVPSSWEATGTILDEDGASPNPGQGSLVSYLSTRGSEIVDESGQAVRLSAVNWFGLETTRASPDGLNVRNWQDMMLQMADLGFNAIRLPFSSELLDGRTPTGISYTLNPDLTGLSGVALIDKIVGRASELGLRIILDHHRSSAGDGPNLNGVWYDGSFTEADWIADWVMLAHRYAGNPTVIGVDLHNEPREQATWGDGNPLTDWEAAAERAGVAIQAVNPDLLIIVEGITRYDDSNPDTSEWYWQGGNLQGARQHPVDLPVTNKLVYSPHDYPNSVYAQPWLQAADYADKLQTVFDGQWGYIAREGIAPILIGEIGTKLEDPKDLVWLAKMKATIGGDFDGNGIADPGAPVAGLSWAWWAWNPNSGDTGGILKDDWRTPDQAKLAAVASIMSPAFAPVLIGNEEPNRLVGAIRNDVIHGNGGDDTLFGGAGNDEIDGGTGNDLVIYSGDRSDYIISSVADGFIVADTRSGTGAEGTDHVLNVEFFQFSNGAASATDLLSGGELSPNSNPSPISGPFFSLFRSGVWSQETAAHYSGPVAHLQYQLLGTARDEVAIGTASNDFINLLGGTDGANGGGGDDVLDGGTGSNFLSGNTGRDVFFLDGRGASSGTVTWSTIADWQAGEQLSLWGWRPGVSKVMWIESDGAVNFRGATLHADLDGNGGIDTSVTWTGLTQAQLVVPHELNGLLWFV